MVALHSMDGLFWSPSEVIWRSRRGLLELDLILMPYCRECYSDLSVAQQKDYQWLLQQTDMDLQKWLLWRRDLDSLSLLQQAALQRVWDYVQDKLALENATLS